MGIGDRDYMGGGGGAFFREATTANPGTILIMVNLAVYFLWFFLPVDLMRDHFTITLEGVLAGRVWTIVTAGFSHKDFTHLLFNMLIFFFLGRILMERWGSKRFLWTYVGMIVFANLFHLGSIAFGLSDAPTLGASGGVNGLLVALAIYHPNLSVLFMFLFPVKLKYVAVVGVLADLYGFIEQPVGSNIGYGVHIGGALAAVLFVKFLEPRLGYGGAGGYGGYGVSTRRERRREKVRGRVIRPDESTWRQPEPPREPDPDEKLLDMLLQKVQEGGLDSLTPEERVLLEQISERRRSSRR